MTSAARADKKLHYAWIAAGVTFFTLLAAAGARATPGVILLPFGNEFQWSRATVSSIVSINIFLYGLIGPFAAALFRIYVGPVESLQKAQELCASIKDRDSGQFCRPVIN